MHNHAFQARRYGARNTPGMWEKLPIVLVGLILVLLAGRGILGTVNLLVDGRVLHALPSGAVSLLALVALLGVGLRKRWGRNVSALGLFLAGTAGVSGLGYAVMETGIAAPTHLPQLLVMSVACLLAAWWLQCSAAARRYFAR